MEALSGWQRRFVLLFKSEKRLDAPIILKTFTDKSIEDMKAAIITEAMCDAAALTNKPRTNDLQAHLDNLKHQFIGRSELCFYHATLVVLLRRNYKTDKTFSNFEQLWTAESDYLLNHLSLRWIMSGCDTFIDHSNNMTRTAILMNVVTLINTLRVYETEQFLKFGSIPNVRSSDDDEVEALYRGGLSLYDGLFYLRVGTDDTLKNMRGRYENFYAIDRLAATILLSVFDKLQTNSSAFFTLRSLHRNEKSKWWLD